MSIVNMNIQPAGAKEAPLTVGDELVRLQQAADAALQGTPSDIVDGDISTVDEDAAP